jgi:hypothetical protein
VALLVRIYFNAVFGALGGLMGWMLFGVFGNKTAAIAELQMLLGGALIGGTIGYFVVSVEAIRDYSLVRFSRLATYGVVLGAIGGAIGMLLGNLINTGVVTIVTQLTGSNTGLVALLGGMLARGLGWMLLGIAIGASEGIAARSLGKFSYGSIGGALGGLIGGALFGLFYLRGVQAGQTGTLGGYATGALGLIILGACIGSLSAFVQGVMQPASVKVLRGWQEGREYPLDRQASLLGRDEHADIALFRDMKVEKRHAFIRRDGNRFILVNNNAPVENTRVNEEPVAREIDLKDGDRIQLGNVVLRFQMRAAQARGRPGGARPVVAVRR